MKRKKLMYLICAWILWELVPDSSPTFSKAVWDIHSAYETRRACEKQIQQDKIGWGLKCLPDTVKPGRRLNPN